MALHKSSDRIIVVGAGPVGMVAALNLATAGIPVIVLERNDDLAIDLRASTFQPATLDMLAVLGLTGEMLRMGVESPILQYRDRKTGIYAEFDHGILKGETAYPFRLQCEQFKLTQIVKKRLETMDNVELCFGFDVSEVEQNLDQVVVKSSDANREPVAGRYLIGADGAQSAVRQKVGFTFEGFTHPEASVDVSTPFSFDKEIERLSPVTYVSDPEEWFTLVRVPGLWRVGFATREDKEKALTDEALQAKLQKLLPRSEPYTIAHRIYFRLHERVANTYRAGRVLLAGDAAHLNNPLGGMGMNSGIHDAINLTEKLIQIWSRTGSEDLLDLYVRQRRPVAIEYVQATAQRNKKRMEETDPRRRAAFQDELRRTAEDPKLAYEYLMNAAMIKGLRNAAMIE